ncbi:MAG: hypothetical protein KY460_13065 [Actinobacteria bacterium]|nr:hypothetical protein [Actinomycetota bacterium]
MGYRGKAAEQARARELRAQAWTLQDIADELGVAKSSVSLWVRDVVFTPRPRHGRTARRRVPNKLQLRKHAEINELLDAGRRCIGNLSRREFLVAGAMLYAGEGSKRDGCVGLANTDPSLVQLFCHWLRTFFDVDETRLRARLYLHDGLDLAASVAYWSRLIAIPPQQFTQPYRAVRDSTLRRSKHVHGCLTVRYGCSRTHRRIMGLVTALHDPSAWFGTDAAPELRDGGC